jgi:hypothetical protein
MEWVDMLPMSSQRWAWGEGKLAYKLLRWDSQVTTFWMICLEIELYVTRKLVS